MVYIGHVTATLRLALTLNPARASLRSCTFLSNVHDRVEADAC